jgi:hypothetical protein
VCDTWSCRRGKGRHRARHEEKLTACQTRGSKEMEGEGLGEASLRMLDRRSGALWALGGAGNRRVARYPRQPQIPHGRLRDYTPRAPRPHGDAHPITLHSCDGSQLPASPRGASRCGPAKAGRSSEREEFADAGLSRLGALSPRACVARLPAPGGGCHPASGETRFAGWREGERSSGALHPLP